MAEDDKQNDKVDKVANNRGKPKRRVRRSDKIRWGWMGFAFLALVVVVIAIVQVNQLEPIDSSYFVSDDSKIVASMDAEMAAFENSEWEAPMTYVVYYVGADGKIENVRVFYEYNTEAEAREAMRYVGLGDFATQKKLNGRYIILQAKASQYEGTTADEIRENIRGLESVAPAQN